MTAQSIVCGSCANEVPYGRLSCPSCGELLASVAGSRRASTGTAARSAVRDVLYDAGSAPGAAVVDGPLSQELAAQQPPAHRPPTRDPAAELPWAASITQGTGDAGIGHDGEAHPEDDVEAAFMAAPDGASATAGPAWAVGTAGLGATRTPAYMPRPAYPVAPVAPVAPVSPVPDQAFAGPGAYVPPMPVASIPAGPPAPAREWAGHPPTDERRPDAAAATSAAGSASAADRQARFAEFVGWLSVAGAAFGAVGFLLPWGMVVIGSAGVGYFDRWGLSGPGHLIVAFAMLAVLAMTLIKNPIPVWIRTGLLGLGAGAYLLGLVWPYVFALPGTGPGAVIAAIGAVALTVAGLLALIMDRHWRADRPV